VIILTNPAEVVIGYISARTITTNCIFIDWWVNSFKIKNCKYLFWVKVFIAED